MATTTDVRTVPTLAVRGIGEVFAAQLAATGITTAYDLLWFIPRAYRDFRIVWSLGELYAAESAPSHLAVGAEIHKSKVVRGRGHGRTWIEAELRDEAAAGHRVIARWFGMPAGFAQQLRPGQRVVLAGAVQRGAGSGTVSGGSAKPAYAFANPRLCKADVVPGLVPVYGHVEGIAAGRLRLAVQACVRQFAHAVADETPGDVLAEVGLPALRDAFAALHDPNTIAGLSDAEVAELGLRQSRWHRRLLWSECFALGVRFAVERERLAAQRAPMIAVPEALAAELGAALPFALTEGQAMAVADIGRDLALPTPMRRLLVGDVGSGKTAVAFAAMLQTVRAGYQAALIAPTEVLAAQHAATLGAWATRLGLGVEVFTGTMSTAQQTAARTRLREGAVSLVVGTHALLGNDVAFARLGLYIVDEQHRFGVAQRGVLAAKGAGGCAHGLIMSATPIPRSLALTLYGELDPTWLRDRPPGACHHRRTCS
ncbi:MAG: DEAD/DEAH box helicase [Myxococcales bacterium]|nr:DEAD/DEAH box helicase [Myxococcales bacterium]